MQSLARLSAIALLSLAVHPLVGSSAFAITAELANKCRQMALKAHPHKTAGSKTGNAEASRTYFQACVKNDGNMPDAGGEAAPPAPAPK